MFSRGSPISGYLKMKNNQAPRVITISHPWYKAGLTSDSWNM
jgi:hypothetical protein